jgi:hypothetical protein
MADGRRRSSNASRTVAPLAPLAIALVMGALLPSGHKNISESEMPTETEAAVCTDDIVSFQDCHSRFPNGCSAKAGYDPYLNLLKNQLTPPAPTSKPEQVFTTLKAFENLDKNTPPDLTRSNHEQFKDDLAKLGEGKRFEVVGFLYYAQVTGAESSNCLLDSKGDHEGTNVDFHIGIGFDPDLAQKVTPNSKPKGPLLKQLQQNSIIVEMTPHYRFSFEEGIWTIDNLQNALGKQVRVVGQLLIDSEHNLPGQNCALATTSKERQSCWRASTWELHPVVEFQVCKTDSCGANSAVSDWAELDNQGSAGVRAGGSTGGERAPAETTKPRPRNRKSQPGAA